MYRKVTVTDAEGKKIKLELYPESFNLTKTEKYEIDMTMAMRIHFNNLLGALSVFMDGNTINKVECEEET